MGLAANVDVGLTVNTFVEQGSRLVANGRVVATCPAADGTTQTASQPFTAKVLLGKGTHRLAASTATTCSVLYLELDKLSLTLLGLDANSLFCKLAKTKVSLRGLASTAHHLTRAVQATGPNTVNSGVGFSVPLVNGAATATINQVHLTITADPTGGVLGSLFCSLAHATATVPTLPSP